MTQIDFRLRVTGNEQPGQTGVQMPISETTQEQPGNRRDMLLNVGPSHPAMHGVIRILAELEGETITKTDIEIGYLHRAFEKSAECGGYQQVIPYTDRLNYVSPMINNFGYCLAVEKLMGIEVTPRCQYIRVLFSEISRVTDHLTCIAASAMELGAMTAFLYLMKAREYLYELVESVCGARLTVSYGRIGGVSGDLPDGFAEKAREAFKETRKVLDEVDKLLSRNRIFVDRLKGIGTISQQDAISFGFTGPVLRSTGVNYDVRKHQPYLVYDQLEFEVPLGSRGDNLDRYLVRMMEMEQSLRISEQCLKRMPVGPINVTPEGEPITAAAMVDRAKMGQTRGIQQTLVQLSPNLEGLRQDRYSAVTAAEKRAVLPAKKDTYGNIEGLMNHFMLIMDWNGIKPPGEKSIRPSKAPMENWAFMWSVMAREFLTGFGFVLPVLL